MPPCRNSTQHDILLTQQNLQMENLKELEKSKRHIIVEIIEYVPQAVVSRMIIKKTTGNITATSMDIGEELGERTTPFDTFVQIIDGTAELIIDEHKVSLKLGEGIIIPAHTKHGFTANEQFKMITTTIKSGYDDENLSTV
jgi:quercetin dioxygenase-like cupin family protein